MIARLISYKVFRILLVLTILLAGLALLPVFVVKAIPITAVLMTDGEVENLQTCGDDYLDGPNLVTDHDQDGVADPGDTFHYFVCLANYGNTDATGVEFIDAIDTNTTLEAGSLSVTPIARHDIYSTDKNTTLNVNVPDGILSNDNDPDGQSIFISLADSTSSFGGTVTMNANGSFRYEPPADSLGSDKFSYWIEDTDGNLDQATVFIEITDPEATAMVPGNDAIAMIDTLHGLASEMVAGLGVQTAHASGESFSVTLGTLNPHQVVYITFDVTVDTTFPTNISQVCNQGLLVGDNFADEISLDPNSGGATCTPVPQIDLRIEMTDSLDPVLPDNFFSYNITTFNDGPLDAQDVVVTDFLPDGVTLVATLGCNNDPNGVPSCLLGTIAAGDSRSFIIDATAPLGEGTIANNASLVTSTPHYEPNTGNNIASVGTLVQAANTPLVANNDRYATIEETLLSASGPGVLDNDTDFDGGSLSIILDSITGNGSLAVEDDGSFSYEPDAGFCGRDTFTYHINDSQAVSNVATVTIDVTCVNDPPIADDDAYTIDEDEGYAYFDVLDNDSDEESDPLTAKLLVAPSNGDLKFVSIYKLGLVARYVADPNFYGEDSFAYEACDPSGLCDSANVIITVNPVFDLPLARFDYASTREDNAIIIDVAANDDFEYEYNFYFTSCWNCSPRNGEVANNDNGTFTYTPNQDFYGDDSFTYHLCDDEADLCDWAYVFIDVTPAYDPPNNDFYLALEDTALVVTLDGLLDNDDSSSIDRYDTATAFGGTVVANSDGSFRYIAAANFAGIDSFTYDVPNDSGGFDTATAFITVNPVNDTPVLAIDQTNIAVDEGNSADNAGTVDDVDGDTVTLTASIGTVINNNDGDWSWSFSTGDGPSDSQTVTIFADDGNGSTAQIDFYLTVNNVAPSVESITVPSDPVNINDQPFTVTATFSDPAGANDVPYSCMVDYDDGGDPLPGTVSGFTCSGQDHTYVEPGVYEITVTVSDKDGDSSSATATGYIIVFDPSGGFVTGGGWIDSPEGACQFAECGYDTIGIAHFGFVSLYKKGASIPTGQTEFQFAAGDLNFHSATYQWLVVNQGGTNAQYKGSGTINGDLTPNSEAFKFMIWAIDLDPVGDDTFRIRIWYEDESDNEIDVYDNGFNQTIGGGNIQIHK